MAALSVHYVMVVLPLLTGSDREGHGAALREIARLIDKGLVRPIVDQRRFTLATAAEAFALLESGAARIKAVLDIAED